MNKIKEFLLTHFGEATLPRYACGDIIPNTIYSIEKGVIHYNSNMLYSQYLEWKKKCKEELSNCSIVDFYWKGKRYKVIFMPHTKDHSGRMCAFFTHEGTSLHILYDEEKKDFLVYCNFIIDYLDRDSTSRYLEINYIIKPKF